MIFFALFINGLKQYFIRDKTIRNIRNFNVNLQYFDFIKFYSKKLQINSCCKSIHYSIHFYWQIRLWCDEWENFVKIKSVRCLNDTILLTSVFLKEEDTERWYPFIFIFGIWQKKNREPFREDECRDLNEIKTMGSFFLMLKLHKNDAYTHIS